MAARAALCIGLVVGDVLVADHAGRAVGAHLSFVDTVARCAVGVAFAQRDIGETVKPWQLGDFVTVCAAGLRGDRAAVRLVTGQALPMSFRAL